MPTSSLTRNQIVDTALIQAGNTGITSTAYTWLNNILDRLYDDYKWPFLESTKTGTLAKDTATVDLPSDFGDVWDRHSFVLIDGNNNDITLQIIAPDDYDLLTKPTTAGTPSSVMLNLAAGTWTTYPVTDTKLTYQLRYRKKPARISTDVVVGFPNDELLIQAVFVKALQYEDDNRYGTELVVLQGLINRYFGGFNKSPVKKSHIRLNADRFRAIQGIR